MLTLFATPKPFRGHIKTIQRNAIVSWTRLRPQPEIILLGQDEGTAEIAEELSLTHIPAVDCNEHGTPLLNSVFETAQAVGKGPWFCYVNSDIILFNDFMSALNQVSLEKFMLTGQRCNTDILEPINFDDARWEEQVRSHAAASGRLEGPQAMDYFVFPRHLYQDLPQFAIGRPGYDNWLLYKALNLGVPVIDGTGAITAIHQNHDYNHHPEGKTGVYTGSEAKVNVKLMGGRDYAFFMLDLASYLLTPQGLETPKWTHASLYRCFEMLPLVKAGLREYAALLKHLLDHRFYLDLEDDQANELCQRLGEVLFSKPGQLFWFSFSAETSQDLLLPTPAQREVTETLQVQLQQARSELEQCRQASAAMQAQLVQSQVEIEHLQTAIAAMKTSKFWKLRKVWFRLKQLVRQG